MNDQLKSRYVVGIDLGTTNSVLSYIDTAGLEPDEPLPAPKVLPIPQIVAPGQVEARPTLPSFLYLAAPGELPRAALDLPWSAGRTYAVGEFARQHGLQVPMRLVSSAKSWLSYSGVDRSAPILPFGAPDAGDEAVAKISPVDASARYLMHLRDAWDHEMAADDDGHQLAEQDVLLTVPASFDAIARELTVRAAQAAGLKRLTLLEEPQAAFYAWLGEHAADWRQQLQVGDVVLICDVGGGTTDFSLIAVTERDGDLQLERIAVGEHILLGGDNMDLTLGVSLMRRLEGQGHRLDPWQRRALVHSCRLAKEVLLTERDREAAPVVVLGRGAKVIGGSIKTELRKEDVERALLDGFLPEVPLSDRPRVARRVGLQEIGLPFAPDPAITRHLAKFLGDHRMPTAVLFNGGVMKGSPLRGRIEATLAAWRGEAPRALAGTDLDLAVAQGAAYYGLVRRGRGLRIRGGTARAYYIGFEASMPAVPGLEPPLLALCVAPRGMEEGTEADVPGQELGLLVGEPVEFRFLTSATRKGDAIGDVVPEVTPETGIEELAPVNTALPPGPDQEAGALVPVRLHTRVTEVGVLELWCVSRDGSRRWKLEYNIRERPDASAT
jgi:molecular chaperone DnaK (HSP70)